MDAITGKEFKSILIKIINEAIHQWLTHVILATWKAEIGRIAVQAHLGKK
jgi:hypothetical protein